MQINEIQIIPIKANNGLVAFGSLLFDNCLFLGSIGIHKKLDGSGYRITYPTKKIGNTNINIYHPINKEASKQIETAIILKVKELLG
ncbi:MAG: septation protein SpoVG family protein [Clostridia bacterium]|nr:septation protein SpoVG family protein [Clostridia bacterium]